MKIHILKTGEVQLSPSLAYCNNKDINLHAHGLLLKSYDRIAFPVLSFLIQTGDKNILVDTGIKKSLESESPLSLYKQYNAIGAPLAFTRNHFHLPKDTALIDRLEEINISPKDIDYVLLTHLDFENVSGVADINKASKILVSRDEARAAVKSPLRYSGNWWKGSRICVFDWKGADGPFKKSLDLLGDGSVVLISLSGHSAGMFGVKITSESGKFVLLYSDAGYGEIGWKELAPPAVSIDRESSMRSLEWVRVQSLEKNCAYSISSHESNTLQILNF